MRRLRSRPVLIRRLFPALRSIRNESKLNPGGLAGSTALLARAAVLRHADILPSEPQQNRCPPLATPGLRGGARQGAALLRADSEASLNLGPGGMGLVAQQRLRPISAPCSSARGAAILAPRAAATDPCARVIPGEVNRAGFELKTVGTGLRLHIAACLTATPLGLKHCQAPTNRSTRMHAASCDSSPFYFFYPAIQVTSGRISSHAAIKAYRRQALVRK